MLALDLENATNDNHHSGMQFGRKPKLEISFLVKKFVMKIKRWKILRIAFSYIEFALEYQFGIRPNDSTIIPC